MDSFNISRAEGVGEVLMAEATAKENALVDPQKDQESADFEYVSKTDLTPPNESEPSGTTNSGNLNDFVLDSFTSSLTDKPSDSIGLAQKGSISPEKLSNPDRLMSDASSVAATLISTANFISAESGNIDRPVSPSLISPMSPDHVHEEAKFDEPKTQWSYDDPVVDESNIYFSPKEEIDDTIIEKTLVSNFEPEQKVKEIYSAEPEEMEEPLFDIPEPRVLTPELVTPVVPEIKVSCKEDEITKPVQPLVEATPSGITEPMELFCKMGLDAWFNPERLHPKVVELVYWRDAKKSGIVFGSGLGILLSLSFFSLISVVAYLSLLLLTGTICFRIYKNVLQAVQKTSDGHPFKDILNLDLTLPQEKVREVTDVGVAHLNAAALELRRLFLVEDLVDSIKFAVLLWCLTYVGSWFNGMTLIIIGFVAMFTLPKVYENNKSQIDQNLDLVRAKLADISAKVKAAVPIGKKPVVEEKKEQ